MSYMYDPYGRRRRMPGPASRPVDTGGAPTIEDYRKLVDAYQELQKQHEQRGKELAEVNRELAINKDALKRQSADYKQLEAELVWTKAALQQHEEQADASDKDELTWEERFRALQAEVEAMRKRWDQRFEVETTEARHRILRDMLPLADHLELALQHSSGLDSDLSDDFMRNIKATLAAFLDTLQRYGVKPMDALGQPFDPERHEAIGQEANEQYPSGTVSRVVRTGYVEEDRLLRPARVMVAA